MCELTQFVISVPIQNIHAHEVALILFQESFLKTGTCGLIIIDASSTLGGIFANACLLLGIQLHGLLLFEITKPSVPSNSSVTSTKPSPLLHVHGTSLVWVKAFMIYTWNCSPIDGTKIPSAASLLCFANSSSI
jgi:hypothetical protein